LALGSSPHLRGIFWINYRHFCFFLICWLNHIVLLLLTVPVVLGPLPAHLLLYTVPGSESDL
jgi:hypothetical protein